MQNTKANGTCLGKYAFLIHPITIEDLYDCGPTGFNDFNESEWNNWKEWVSSWAERLYEPGVAYHLPKLHSKTGGYAEGWLISIPLTPMQLMKLKPRDKTALLTECAEKAKELGVDILGLGAFTSIISRGGVDMQDCGINITTGNSLTAMVAAQSLRQLADQVNPNLYHEPIGIVGAAGSVGQLATRKLAMSCADITLFGNPANPTTLRKLAGVAGMIYRDALITIKQGGNLTGVAKKLQQIVDDPDELMSLEPDDSALYDYITNLTRQSRLEPFVKLTIDLEKYLPQMRFVLSATSQGAAFIDSSMLTPGTIVCDASRPADVKGDVSKNRPDVFVYEGGLVSLPEDISFGRTNIINCQRGVNLSCLSETIVLAMSGIRRNYSIGTNLPLDDAENIYAKAVQHGFNVFTPDVNQYFIEASLS